MTRMPSAARLTLLTVALGACGPKGEPATDQPPTLSAGAGASGELVYVTNEDSRDLTVIDAATDSVVATIPVGTRPRGVEVSPDGRTVYVALTGSPVPAHHARRGVREAGLGQVQDGVAIVDVATRTTIKTIPAGSDPEEFDLSADGTRLFVSNEDADSASIVDLASGRPVANVKVGDEPEGVTVAPDGKTVWVTGETDHDITGFDAATGAIVARIDVLGQRPRSIGFLPDGSRAYVTNEMSGTVSVVDMVARTTLRQITMPTDSRPMSIVVTPDGRRIYISNGRGKTVSAIDPATDAVTATVEVGVRPWGIALSGDGRKLYTANGPGNDVTVIDTETMTVLKRIPAGTIPWGVAIGPKP
ncbi:MAG: beta-propeller fold lactonase family protein [Gemmatimonadetes bacterium]|nr:beta-propeller fold lactonase family protein [Gemmatimonadota bacterium]